MAGLVTDLERENALEDIFSQIDGYHQDSIIITNQERKSREGKFTLFIIFNQTKTCSFLDKQMEQMQLQMETLRNQMDSNFTKINDDLNNIYYETNDIKHINHNLVLLQEEMSQFHTDELPTLQKERH